MSREAASPFKGSVGFGYIKSWGRKVSKMFNKSVITYEITEMLKIIKI
jgi:hypothetical protein